MLEEIQQEFPALGEEESGETKKDPFAEMLEGEDATLTEQQPSYQIGDGALADGFSETQMQQLQELMEMQQLQEMDMQQTELTTSVAVDVDTFNAAINNLMVELSSVMVFCAFLVAGTMAAIKLWSVRL